MKKYFLLIIAVSLIAFQACKKDEINEEKHEKIFYETDKSSSFASSGATVLGSKLRNPYSVSNMQTAYSNLQEQDPNFPELSISTNYRYIKFMPENEFQLDLLKEDSTIVLYDIPLDYEIVTNGCYYHDPMLPDTAITYQYCSVPIGKVLPDVPYSVLANLFIPPIEQDIYAKNVDMNPYYEALEEEAYRITGNLDSDDKSRSNYWTPSGTIRMRDDVLGIIPIEGIKVRARRWFTTYTGITNSQGYFECDGQFKNEVNYSFNWERYHFSVRSGDYGQAKYDGPKQIGDWNLLIDSGSHEFYAIIFRAAYHYYYGYIQNLRRPPLNDTWYPQMKISANYEYNDMYMGYHHYIWYSTIGILSRIDIYNPQVDADKIYGATIHELAHASHWNIDKELYSAGGSSAIQYIVTDSWANGVQWTLTKMIYPNYQYGDYVRCWYTGLIEDLIDGTGNTESLYYYDGNGGIIEESLSYYDRVTSYTIKQMEDALVGVRTWNEWKNNIKRMYDNSTESYLDNAFTYWNTQFNQRPPVIDDNFDVYD